MSTFAIEARDAKITVLVEIEALSDKEYLVYIDGHTEAG
jgi:hypothetical protein